MSLDHEQANDFFSWIYDYPITEVDIVKVGIGSTDIPLQHILAPETLEVMNGQNNPPELV